MTIRASVASIALVAATTFVTSNTACAQLSTAARYDLPAQELEASLRAVGRISGRQVIIATDAVSGKSAPALHGIYESDHAISLLLTGSAVRVRFTADAALVGASDVVAEDPAITVTGTRIRGASVASPVISITRDDMANAGQANLGDVVRSIPQSFSGGQNPNVVLNSGGSRNDNFNSASTINLRGLGADATLTLLNGHRLSYDGAAQAVDVSTIPVAAVERIEIVADGSSAIYGSDAVGGVANIILRKDFSGIQTDARFAGTTDGGGFRQQYSAIAGQNWSTGGLVATYNFERTERINANQRSYTRALNYSTNLLPFERQHSAILTAHQSITPDLTLLTDITFSHRFSAAEFALTAANPYTVSGAGKNQTTLSYSIAPRLEWRAPRGWLVALSTVYGYDKTKFISNNYNASVLTLAIPGRYRNTSKIAELSAEGAVLSLPGGPARVALGLGYRDTALANRVSQRTPTASSTTVDFDKTRSSSYGYGELFLPFVTPKLDITGISRFEVTAALRYERYGRLGNLATPKFGLVYAPVNDVALRATWGKSFKTPTLFQQYNNYRLSVVPPAQVGGQGAPAGSSVLFASGGNPDLISERATSWTAGLKFTPHIVPGFILEGSFFHVNYRNRINTPGVQLNGALTNPLYQQVITRSPSRAFVDALLAEAATAPAIQSGATFDPDNIFAFIDSRNLNVSAQAIQGIDMALNYRRDLAEQSSINITANAAYLESSQKLLANSTSTQLAGLIYNPPHWRARGGGTFTDHGLAASAFINYVGPVTDNVAQPFQKVSSMTTIDTVLRIPPHAGNGILNGVSCELAISNLFNAKPDIIRVSLPVLVAFDSTNYSSIGRQISLTISKRW